MMKHKLYALLLAGAMALSLAACGTNAAGMEVIARMDQAGIEALGSYANDVEVTISFAH